MGNHLVLTVDQLPTEANPSGVWYVDTGLGDALHEPLPLAAGRHEQPPFRLTLEQVDDGSTWHLSHDWFEPLADRFELRSHTSTPEARDRLWASVLGAHRRWLATQT